MTDAFARALAAMDAGDVAALRKVLATDRDVVRERVETRGPVYGGYFARATLLHHVAGNPIRGPLPPNIVEVAKALIDAGADVHAVCGVNGESSILGLVASALAMAESGLYRPMIDLLLTNGVSFENDRGVLSVCLYHTVECKKQREVGEYLVEKGARVDLVHAAALGRIDLVRSLAREDGTLTEDAHGPFRIDGNARRDAGDAAIKQEALVWAAMNGREATIAQLLDLGADIQGKARVARWNITALHGAAWSGWVSACAYLLQRGADFTLINEEEQSSPIGWAAYCYQKGVVDLFKRACAGRIPLADLIIVGELDELKAALAGVNPNSVPAGRTAAPGYMLRIASLHGRTDVVRLLLDLGADPHLRNAEGTTALDYALQRGKGEVAALLQARTG